MIINQVYLIPAFKLVRQALAGRSTQIFLQARGTPTFLQASYPSLKHIHAAFLIFAWFVEFSQMIHRDVRILPFIYGGFFLINIVHIATAFGCVSTLTCIHLAYFHLSRVSACAESCSASRAFPPQRWDESMTEMYALLLLGIGCSHMPHHLAAMAAGHGEDDGGSRSIARGSRRSRACGARFGLALYEASHIVCRGDIDRRSPQLRLRGGMDIQAYSEESFSVSGSNSGACCRIVNVSYVPYDRSRHHWLRQTRAIWMSVLTWSDSCDMCVCRYVAFTRSYIFLACINTNTYIPTCKHV